MRTWQHNFFRSQNLFRNFKFFVSKKCHWKVCQGRKCGDVSAAHDRSILAWAKKVFIYSKLLYELYIASDTKIKLQNARGLFWGYENLCEINLDKWIDSSSVSDMSYMFCGCHSLKNWMYQD